MEPQASSYHRYNHDLFLSETPLQVMPSLATAIGLHEGLLLQQIHYWLNSNLPSHQFKGVSWVELSDDLLKHKFSFWTFKTLEQTIHRLEDEGLLKTHSMDEDSSKTPRWFTIDYQKLAEVEEQIYRRSSPKIALKQGGDNGALTD